jgi:hypothetical protein
VYSGRELLAAIFIQSAKASKPCFAPAAKFELYSVALCFPAFIIAIIAIALYLKERNKKL